MTYIDMQHHLALEGSLFYLQDDFEVDISDSTILHGKAFHEDGENGDNCVDCSYGDGGAFYLTQVDAGATDAYLYVKDCTEDIAYFESQSDGGFMYAAHPDAEVTFDECSWNHLDAQGEGALMYGQTETFDHILLDPDACVMSNVTGGILSS
jgi:hypothetical protein